MNTKEAALCYQIPQEPLCFSSAADEDLMLFEEKKENAWKPIC